MGCCLAIAFLFASMLSLVRLLTGRPVTTTNALPPPATRRAPSTDAMGVTP